jgi:hypothetical protein
MIPESSLALIRERMNTYGPKNCWTGVTGTLAADINRLLAEVARLKVENLRLQEAQQWVDFSK